MEHKTFKRDVSIENLKSGMKILLTIFDKTGKPLILKDTIVTDKMLSRISGHDFDRNNKIPVEETVNIMSSSEEDVSEITEKILSAFSSYKNDNFYDYIKKKSLKAVEYLYNKKKELYVKNEPENDL